MPEVAATPPVPPGTPGQVQPPAQPVPLAPASDPARIQWRHGFPAALIAGVVIAIASVVPFLGFLVWVFAGGVLVVLLYQRRQANPVTPGMGARLGVVAGLLGFGMLAIVVLLGMVATRGALLRSLWSQFMQQAAQQAAQNPNPAVQDMVQRLNSPEGMAVVFTFAMVFLLAFFLVLSSIGGAVGARLFGRREK